MLNPSFSYPEFWRERTWKQACLLPLACLYQIGYRLRRLFVRAYTPSIPVLCIGNLVAGGAGKTPVALAVGQWAHENSLKACYLSRGYGGSLARPAYVTQNHSAEDVGDEPLLLARTLPTMVAKNRVQGAK
ncbi:MAG: tetraacyldisaccharide 4'-kinase, partial [Rickettsiales bacterium]